MTQRTDIDGQELILFHVDIAPRAVMVRGNGFPYRVQDTVVRESDEVINQRKTAWRSVGYERIVNPGSNIADIDIEAARQFSANTSFSNRSPEDNLLRLRLANREADGFAPVQAAFLLFGKDPARLHSNSGVRLFRVQKGVEAWQRPQRAADHSNRGTATGCHRAIT